MILFLYYLILYFRFFLIIKILLQDQTLNFKEFIYILLTGLMMTTIRINAVTLLNAMGVAETEMLISPYLFVMPVAFLYLYAIKSYSIKKACILVFVATIGVAATTNNLLIILDIVAWPDYVLLVSSASYFLSSLAAKFALAILFTSLLEVATRKLRKTVNQSQKLQTILMCLAIGLTILLIVLRIIFETNEPDIMLMTSILFVLHIFALLPYIVAAFAYTRIMKQKYALQREHDEQQNLQYHLEELEKQYTAIRKFKHDYQNILISMDVFFAKDDYTNLKQYYNQQIKPASEIITKDNFMLEALSRIKIPEVKSILAVKLLMAQNTNININTSFEAPDKIDSIPISSIALVRMLGIILDNAIEELTELSGGNLSVACFKDDENLTFIIQNTCRTNIPKLHELKQAGFSTKNKGCGLGLNILNEIEANHPNLTLSTTIAADIFTQKLTIRTEAKKMTLKE